MKIGVITFTDGRARVAKATDRDCHMFQERIAAHLKKKKHQVTVGRQIVWNYATAHSDVEQLWVPELARVAGVFALTSAWFLDGGPDLAPPPLGVAS